MENQTEGTESNETKEEEKTIWKFLENHFNQLNKSLEEYSIQTEKILEETTTPEKEEAKQSALDKRAKQFFNEFGNLNKLKEELSDTQTQLKQKELQIANLDKSIVNLQRMNEILEEKVKKAKEKLNATEKDLENTKEESKQQIKSWEDALMSMQEDIDSLEKEKAELIENLSSNTKSGSNLFGSSTLSGIASLASNAGGGMIGNIPFNLVSKEIANLQSIINYLHLENAQLRSKESANKLKENLPPLQLDASIFSASNKKKLTPLQRSTTNEIQNYKTQIQALSNQMNFIRSNPRVVSLSIPSSSPSSSSSLPGESLNTATSEIHLISKKVGKINDEVKLLLDKLSASSSNSNFISPEYFKAPAASSNQILCGKVTIPLSEQLKKLLPANVPRVHQLSVSPATAQQIHSVVSIGSS